MRRSTLSQKAHEGLPAPRAPQFGIPVRTRPVEPVVAKAPTPVAPPPQRVRSKDLFSLGAHEVLIEHRGEIYRLRMTPHDGLILNK